MPASTMMQVTAARGLCSQRGRGSPGLDPATAPCWGKETADAWRQCMRDISMSVDGFVTGLTGRSAGGWARAANGSTSESTPGG